MLFTILNCKSYCVGVRSAKNVRPTRCVLTFMKQFCSQTGRGGNALFTCCRPIHQCSRIRRPILRFFQISKKHDFLRFFWNDVSKSRKSHKKYQVCWMSIEILASTLPNAMVSYRHLSHTVLSCIVSCVHTSEQDVWCWWPWLTGTDFR